VIDIERFRNVIESAEPKSFDGRIERSIARDNDRLDIGVVLLDLLEHVDAAKAGHFEIHCHEIDRELFQHLHRLRPTVRGMHVVIRVENHFERFSWTHLIVND
jgi:hypothetical protein